MKAYMPEENGPNWWRDIPGYGGKYQVNRLGEIRRVFPSGSVRDMTPYKKSGAKHKKILRNRLFVKLTGENGSKEVAVLKIVAGAWHGPTPSGMVPYHKNGIVTDNRAENIGFIDKQTLGRNTGHMAEKRRTVFKINTSGEVVEIYRSAREAAKANHMSYQAVLDRCNLGVLAFVCLLFIVGEPKPPISDRKRGNITTAFVAIVFLIIAANTIF